VELVAGTRVDVPALRGDDRDARGGCPLPDVRLPRGDVNGRVGPGRGANDEPGAAQPDRAPSGAPGELLRAMAEAEERQTKGVAGERLAREPPGGH
jgi:hypothetical protein